MEELKVEKIRYINTNIMNSFFFLGGMCCLIYSLIKADVVYFLLGLIFFLCTVILFIFRKNMKDDLFSPIFVMAGFIILMYGIGGVYLYLNLDGFYQSFISHEDTSIIFALTLIIISIIFTAFGIFIASHTKIVKFPIFPSEVSISKLSFITILGVATGLLIFVVVLKSFGYSNLRAILQNIMQVRARLSMQGVYYIKFISQFLIKVPFFLCVIVYFRNRDRIKNRIKFKLYLALYFLLIIFLGLISGARSDVVYPVLTCIFIYNYLRRRIPVFLIVLFIVSILPFGVAYETFRHFSLKGESYLVSISERIILSLSNISLQNSILRFVTRFNSVFYNFIVLINSWNEKFLYGKSFIDFLLQPIPRVVFPDKPYLFNMEMTKQFYPEFFAIGGGTPFGLIAEGFMNFHLVGVILFATLFGIILGFLQKWYNSNKTNPFFVFVYSQLFLAPWGWLAEGLINSSMNEQIILNLVFCFILYLFVVKWNKERKLLII